MDADGLLTTAVISGAAQGANNAIAQGWTYFLLQECQKYEDMRLQRLNEYDDFRQQRLNAYTTARDTTAFERQRQLAGEEQAAHVQRDERLLTQKQDFERTQQDAEWQAKDASLDKTHRFELMKQQADIGRDLVLHSMRLQDAHQSSSRKLDPRVQAQIEFQMAKLKGLQDGLKDGLLDPDQLKTSKEEVEHIGKTIDQLLGFTVHTQRSQPHQIIDPDQIIDRFDRRTRRPPSSNPADAHRNQPR
jgi:hypothetical protein